MELSAASITAAQNAAVDPAVDAVVDLLDAGAGAGYIEVRSGTQPADPGTAATGTLLATLPLSDPAFGASSGGTATANAVTSDSDADATGTATWFRAFDSDATPVIDGGVTDTSGEDLVLSSTSVVTGGTVSVTSWTFTIAGTLTAS